MGEGGGEETMIGMPPGEGALARRASGPTSDVEASAAPSGESQLRRAADVPLERGLRRELLQRRMVISVGRRVVRVASLHLLDGLLISLGLLGLSLTISAGAEASHYLPAVVAAFLLSLNAVGAYRSGDARRDRNRLASGAFVGTLILGFLSLFPPSLPFGPTFLTALGLTVFLLLAPGDRGREPHGGW